MRLICFARLAAASLFYMHRLLMFNAHYTVPSSSLTERSESRFQAYKNGRREIGEVVANIAEQIGLDDKPGPDHEARKRIEERRYHASYFPCPPGEKGSVVLPCYVVRLKFLGC